MVSIVIIGESGQLAQSLGRLRWPQDCALSFVGRRHAPTGDPKAIAEAAGALRPDLLLNAAAFTGVDRAEGESAAALALNAELPYELAVLAARRSIPMVHVSTDYVFDGAKGAPYLESDAPNPISVYGETKLAGDNAVVGARLQRWAILRSSWVVSEIGETFPVKILRRAREVEALRVVDDQVGCPTAAGELARVMQAVGLRLLAGDEAATGLFNLCGRSAMTWLGLTDLLLRIAESEGLKRPALHAITSADLKAPAQRPAYSVLDCGRIARRLGLEAAPIDAALRPMVRAILSA